MGIRYNKEYISKDRRLHMSGPRDVQRKQKYTSPVAPDVDSETVKALQETIKSLQKQLENTPVNQTAADGTFTADQVNEEIIKAIKVETADLKEKYEKQIKALEIEKATLESKIESQAKEIEKLEVASKQSAMSESAMHAMMEEMKSQMRDMAFAAGATVEEVDPDRPKMETTFIDPISNEGSMESHIIIEEDVSIEKKEEMAGQVNKLKSLLGSLPSKRG